MKITTDDYGTTLEYPDFPSYAENILDGNDYDTGELEALKATARNNSRAIGRLLALLHYKGAIEDRDVGEILQGYEITSLRIDETDYGLL